MINRHWDAIAACCDPRDKVALGLAEGLDNKIRIIRGRAYGLHDKKRLKLEVLTCMLAKF